MAWLAIDFPRKDEQNTLVARAEAPPARARRQTALAKREAALFTCRADTGR
jgi:hypothetical protein